MEVENKDLEWLDFDILANYPDVIGKVFLRHGGTSTGAFNSLNLSDSVGDHPDNVKVNRSFIQKNMRVDNLVFAKQEHGIKIIEIDRNNFLNFKVADGLYTKEKDIGLAVTHADCQAAIFFDKENQIIGIAHAGWRGIIGNIYSKMVENFLREGSQIDNILVSISPSICFQHSEFKNYKKDFPKKYWAFQKDHYLFDFWDIAESQLLDLGIKRENIEISKICTYCNPKDYYSYRRDKITGRHATVVAIKSK